jgi:serine/threonine-protein phosphatase 6 regulatory ankyrin repeat subunit B
MKKICLLFFLFLIHSPVHASLFIRTRYDTIFQAISAHDVEDCKKHIKKRSFSPNVKNVADHTALHAASTYGLEDICQLLLDRGADINALTPEGLTALHFACKEGHPHVCELLINRRININQRDSAYLTALQYAVIDPKSLGCVALLSKCSDIDFGAIQVFNQYEPISADSIPLQLGTPLQNAAFVGNQLACDILLNAGVPIDSVDQKGMTALWYAIMGRQLDVARFLLEKKAQVNLADMDDVTLLHRVSQRGMYTFVELLLAFDANVSALCKDKTTPLHRAALAGNKESVEMLLNHGSPVNAQDSHGITPLLLATKYGREEICKLLLERQASPNIPDYAEQVPLLVSIKLDFRTISLQLMQSGADIRKEIKDNDNNCMLYEHIFSLGNLEICAAVLKENKFARKELESLLFLVASPAIVELLINQNVSINVTNEDGQTPLHRAALMGNLDVCKKLIEYGAQLDLQDNDGWTALHLASGENAKIVDTLLQAGAQTTICTKGNQEAGLDGLTPLSVAVLGNHKNICEILLSSQTLKNDCKKALYFALVQDNKDIAWLMMQSHLAIAREPLYGRILPIHLAVHHGSLAVCQLLLERMEVPVDERGTKECTPLQVASYLGNMALASLLLAKGAQVDACDIGGHTALYWAALTANHEIAQLLLNHGATVNSLKKNITSPLHATLMLRKQDFCKAILCCPIGRLGENVAYRQLTLKKIQSAATDLPTLLSSLKNDKLPPNSSEERSFMISLIEKMLKRYKTTVKLLLQHQAHCDATDSHGLTPLHYACIANLGSSVNDLLEYGANCNIGDNKDGRTPFMKTCELGRLDICKKLIEKGGIIKGLKDAIIHGDALHIACDQGQLNVCQLLLTNGFTSDIPSESAMTVLHRAVKKNNIDLCSLFLKYQKNPNATDKDGNTPLHYCCVFTENENLLKLFLTEEKVDLLAENNEGKNALHYSIEGKKLGLISLLLAYYPLAKISTKDKRGFTHLRHAVITKDISVCRLLIQSLPKEEFERERLSLWSLVKDPEQTEYYNKEIADFLRPDTHVELKNSDIEINQPAEFPDEKSVSTDTSGGFALRLNLYEEATTEETSTATS